MNFKNYYIILLNILLILFEHDPKIIRDGPAPNHFYGGH